MLRQQGVWSHIIFAVNLTNFDNESFFDSQSEHDSAVDSLNEMLNEVESGLSDAEQKKPMYDQNDYVDLEAVMKQMEKQKVFIILL